MPSRMVAVTVTWAPRLHQSQHAARGGTVEVQGVSDPGVDRRDDIRRAVLDEPDVADQRLVENLIHRRAVVVRLLRDSPHTSAFGGCVAHVTILETRQGTDRAVGALHQRVV